MEQEFAKNTYVLQEDEKIGSVKIADDVVAMIAAQIGRASCRERVCAYV